MAKKVSKIPSDSSPRNRLSAETVIRDRMVLQEDLKGAIHFLSSDLSSYVTGQNIIVDGGWSL